MAGVKRHVMDLLNHLDVREFEILFLYSLGRKDNQYEAEIEAVRQRGIRCVDVGFVREIRPMTDGLCFFKVWREIRKFKPQVVHAHSSKAGFIARFAAKLGRRRCKTIYTPNVMACYDSRLYWILEKVAAWVTDRIVAVSRSEARDIRGWKLIADRKVECISLCVRKAGEYPVSKPEGNGVPRVVACGRICVQKQALLFFEVAAAVARWRPDIEFCWIGDFSNDSESEAVRQLRAADPLARKARITGWIDKPDEEIARATLFCMLSRYESFGYVTADAMMMGVAILAVPGTGTIDLIEPDVSGLLREGKVDVLRDAVVQLIDDEALRGRLSVAGRQRVEVEFSRDTMIARISQLYRTVAGEK